MISSLRVSSSPIGSYDFSMENPSVRSLCYRFESDEHADHLSKLLHAALEIILLKCYRFVNLQVHGFIIFIFISVNMLDMSYLSLMVCLEKTMWEYCSQRFTDVYSIYYTVLVLHWSRGFQLISQHFVHCLVRTHADSSCTIFPQTW